MDHPEPALIYRYPSQSGETDLVVKKHSEAVVDGWTLLACHTTNDNARGFGGGREGFVWGEVVFWWCLVVPLWCANILYSRSFSQMLRDVAPFVH